MINVNAGQDMDAFLKLPVQEALEICEKIKIDRMFDEPEHVYDHSENIYMLPSGRSIQFLFKWDEDLKDYIPFEMNEAIWITDHPDSPTLEVIKAIG